MLVPRLFFQVCPAPSLQSILWNLQRSHYSQSSYSWLIFGQLVDFSVSFSNSRGSTVGGPMEIYLETNPTAGKTRLRHSVIDKIWAFCLWVVETLWYCKHSCDLPFWWDKKCCHQIRGKGWFNPCCHLQLQHGCLLVEWGWALVILMQLWLCWCLEICWLLSSRMSSSVWQIVCRKCVWGVTALLGPQADCWDDTWLM